MFEIDEQRLKSSGGSVIYSRGLDMYLRNKVRQINVEIAHRENRGDNLLRLTAVVESAFNNSTYDVDILYSDKTFAMQHECNCEYGKKGNLCKHVVAALLKWSREKNSIMRRNDELSKSKTEELVESIKNGMVKTIRSTTLLNLDIKYEFENRGERLSSIELKIGESKTYIVKNMKEFLGVLRNRLEELEFGKNFIFYPEIHRFNSEDEKIIELLLEIYEMDCRIPNLNGPNSRYFGGPTRFIAGKKAYLTDRQITRFFNIIEGRTIEAVINGQSLSNVKILKEDIPLEFDLDIKESNIILKAIDSIPVPITDSEEYYFYNGNIYKPSEAQKNIYAPFYKEFMRTKGGKITFSSSDKENLASYIIPSLKNIGKMVNIDERLEQQFYEEPLEVSAYFDKEREDITADIIFKYGSREFNPLFPGEDEQQERILIRDIAKETNTIGILNSYSFKVINQRYMLTNEESLVEFLTEGIQKLQEFAEVYYSEAFKGIKVYSSSNIKSSIRLNDEDLLEFSFSIDGVERSELSDILQALRQKKKYFRLKKGDFVSLESNELKDVANMIEYLDIQDSSLEEDEILLSKYNALYIDQNLKMNNMNYIERNRKFRELVNNIRDVQEVDYKVPSQLEGVMRGYQKFGFKWLKTLASCGFGGILADEMGLGKTLQAIAFIQSEVIENGECKPSLVVAPTSLIYNWKSEIEKFAPELKAIVIAGTKEEREVQIRDMEGSNIIITSYPLIRRDIEDYKKFKFKYCILDEAQQIKNPISQNAQSVKEIKAEGFFALTGTPIENSLTELWSIFDFLMPGYLMNHGKFLKKYEIPVVKGNDTEALGELNKHVKPFILRRLKKEVIKELPPKIEHKLVVEMTEEQKKLYAAYIASAKDEIDSEIKEKGFGRSKIKILSVLTRLRQICCEPSVFMDNYYGESGKMLALDELLEESINEGHRILLFSQFTSVLKNISKRLENNNIQYMYLDGQTKAQHRGEMVKEFNEGKGSVFLISLKAGGTGLNLTGADVVIHFDPWWNPAVEDQATDRAHRIGQEKTVEVIKLIARGTIEEKIYKIQEKKKEIIRSVINDENGEEQLLSQMSEDELEELFKF